MDENEALASDRFDGMISMLAPLETVVDDDNWWIVEDMFAECQVQSVFPDSLDLSR